MNQNLCYLSATDAMQRFAGGELSPVTLMQDLLDRSVRMQTSINATTAIFAEQILNFA